MCSVVSPCVPSGRRVMTAARMAASGMAAGGMGPMMSSHPTSMRRVMRSRMRSRVPSPMSSGAMMTREMVARGVVMMVPLMVLRVVGPLMMGEMRPAVAVTVIP